MPKKLKPKKKTKKHAEPKTPRLGELTFGQGGACIIRLDLGRNESKWKHHADAILGIVAPSWSWTHPAQIQIIDHTTNRSLI